MTKAIIRDYLFMLLRSKSLCGNIICDYTLPLELSSKQWCELMQLAKVHGVKYILFDEISKLPEDLHPASDLMLQWYVETKKAEERFRRYTTALEELAAFVSQNTLKMMVLKGYTIARFYPTPPRREGGDIDMFILDGYSKCDDAVREHGGLVSSVSRRSKHSKFLFRGINVDNHKLFVMDSVGLTPKLRHFYGRIEDIIQASVSQGDLDKIEIGEQSVYALKPNVAVLYFITHTFRHVVVEAASVRHFVDWIVLFNHHRQSLDRELLTAQIEECGLGCFVANVELFCRERFSYTPFFNFEKRYTIYQKALSVESALSNFKSPKLERRLFGKIKKSLSKMLCAQRYYAAYIGMNSYRDYLIPNIISRIKELCLKNHTIK